MGIGNDCTTTRETGSISSRKSAVYLPVKMLALASTRATSRLPLANRATRLVAVGVGDASVAEGVDEGGTLRVILAEGVPLGDVVRAGVKLLVGVTVGRAVALPEPEAEGSIDGEAPPDSEADVEGVADTLEEPLAGMEGEGELDGVPLRVGAHMRASAGTRDTPKKLLLTVAVIGAEYTCRMADVSVLNAYTLLAEPMYSV